jgi:hypothetical protein
MIFIDVKTEADLTQFEIQNHDNRSVEGYTKSVISISRTDNIQQRRPKILYKDPEITVVDETNYNDVSSFSAARKLWNFNTLNHTSSSNRKSARSTNQPVSVAPVDQTQTFDMGKAMIDEHMKYMKTIDFSKQVHKIEADTDTPRSVGSLICSNNQTIYLMFEEDIRLYTYDMPGTHNIENCLSTNLVTSLGGKEIRQILVSPAHDILAMALILSGSYQLDLFIDREFVTNFISTPVSSSLRFTTRSESS